MTTSNKPGALFWIIGIVALIWNAIGVMAYLGEAYMSDDTKALLPAEQIDFMNNQPAWVTAVYAIAVFGGLLACILLLARKKIATSLFLLSLLGVLARTMYYLILSNAPEAYGAAFAYTMFIIVIIIAIFLYFYSKKSAAKGWLS